ncbi:MAG: hypothetical protein GX451_02235 [Acholeplasmataceae bacterium]|nr:hypothetical protein [Acholeplasmataceae bacterium]
MSKKSNKFLKVNSDGDGYFGLGRSIDFYDLLNRVAIILVILTSVVATVYKSMLGADSETSAYFGLSVAANVLFAWLIAQELDPDRRLGGIIGGVVALILSLLLGVGNAMVLLWLLFILRLLNRTSGSKHKIGDNILILLLAYWLGKDGYWLYPALTGVAYVLESRLPRGYFRSLYMGGFAFALVALSNVIKEPVTINVTYLYIMAVVFIFLLPAISMAAYTQFKGDYDGNRISPRRLQAAQGSFLVISFAIAWFHGDSQALNMLPAWSAAIGVGISLLSAAVQNALFKKI